MRKAKRELMDKLVNGTADIRKFQETDSDGEHDFIVPNTISGTDPTNKVDFSELTKREAYVAGFLEIA